jgi:hypothetical protein
MSLNRTRYDTCSYEGELKRQTDALSYLLDPVKFYRCDPCRHELGLVGGNEVSIIAGNMVDLENDLRGQTRPLSKCSAYQYHPSKGDSFQRQEFVKPVTHPRVNTQLRHLPSCQMIDYKPIPKEPQLDLFKCL